MKEYYTYIYFDADWIAYYVGKGQKLRRHYRQDCIPVADDIHTQVFQYDAEWEAYECERELITFWGRKSDGGSLMNVCSGGPGRSGYKFSGTLGAKQAGIKISLALTGRRQETLHTVNASIAHRKPITLKNSITGEVVSFESSAAACKTLGLDTGNLSKVITGKYKSHKGWKLND